MIHKERAAKLKKKRGDSLLLIGDPAASSTTINNYTHPVWTTVTFAGLNIILGVAVCIAGGLLAGYGHRLTPLEVRLVEGARQRNVDLDRMSEVEIAARLVLPTDAVASTINVLRLPEELPPDM